MFVPKPDSTFAIAASKITGRPLLGIDPKGAAPVAVWNNEDDMDELHRQGLLEPLLAATRSDE